MLLYKEKYKKNVKFVVCFKFTKNFKEVCNFLSFKIKKKNFLSKISFVKRNIIEVKKKRNQPKRPLKYLFFLFILNGTNKFLNRTILNHKILSILKYDFHVE